MTTPPIPTPISAATNHLPGGIRVISKLDGEVGTVLNAFDSAGNEYEVETRYAIERWQREDFLTFAEAGVEC